jgi:PTS system mannose-specific IIA component
MQPSAIGVIVASHGELAAVLVQSAELILGRALPVRAFAFQVGEEPKPAAARLEAALKRCDKGKGVVLLVDLFGGTPGAMALAMVDGKSVEVVTGVNLPMVLAAAGLEPDCTLAAAGTAIAAAGRDGIKQAGALLKPASRTSR